jgi:hypothetical protein
MGHRVSGHWSVGTGVSAAAWLEANFLFLFTLFKENLINDLHKILFLRYVTFQLCQYT